MLILKEGTIKRIHVNQHIIKANRTRPEEDWQPVFTVKCGGKTYTAVIVITIDRSIFMYQPDKPLSCGATVWVETKGEVQLFFEEEVVDDAPTERG